MPAAIEHFNEAHLLLITGNEVASGIQAVPGKRVPKLISVKFHTEHFQLSGARLIVSKTFVCETA
jgi:hypothetical protein